MSVTLEVNNTNTSSNLTYHIDWPGDLNVQVLLETVYNQAYGGTQPLSFSLEFYGTPNAKLPSNGTGYGYLVSMLNGALDNVTATDYYWFYSINGTAAQEGIDEYLVQDTDTITFTYETYNATQHGTTGPNAAKVNAKAAARP